MTGKLGRHSARSASVILDMGILRGAKILSFKQQWNPTLRRKTRDVRMGHPLCFFTRFNFFFTLTAGPQLGRIVGLDLSRDFSPNRRPDRACFTGGPL